MDVAYSNRGLVRLELEEYESAYYDFEYAIGLDPEDPMHHNNEGILFLEIELPNLALERFHRAIELDPLSAMYHNNLGMAHEELNNPQEADAAYMKALELGERDFLATPETMTSTSAGITPNVVIDNSVILPILKSSYRHANWPKNSWRIHPPPPNTQPRGSSRAHSESTVPSGRTLSCRTIPATPSAPIPWTRCSSTSPSPETLSSSSPRTTSSYQWRLSCRISESPT